MFRILREKNNNKNVIAPEMPLIVILSDDTIIESDSVTSLTASILGSEYVNLCNEDKCLIRIKAARRESMAALEFGINSVITDGKEIIKNNYAADPGDEDYLNDITIENLVKIRIDNEKDFILSLVKLGSIKLLERVDSNIFLNKKMSSKNSKNEYTEVLAD
ncbi:MAG: hypothetical protein ABF289_05600 [Clostridiales bacterium]